MDFSYLFLIFTPQTNDQLSKTRLLFASKRLTDLNANYGKKMQRKLNKTALFLALSIYTVSAFKPLSKEEQIDKFNKMNEEVEPFRRNLTECARQVRATMVDVENFLKRIPQATMQGIPSFLEFFHTSFPSFSHKFSSVVRLING